MRNQQLFQVTNHHGETCGVPPHIDEQTFPGVNHSYFENQNGEQAIFLYDYEQEYGTLYLGDAGWEHPYDVVDGEGTSHTEPSRATLAIGLLGSQRRVERGA